MAVYTEVSFDDLEALLAAYDLGAPMSFKGIAEGVENSNFYLRTDRGAFILTLSPPCVREDDTPCCRADGPIWRPAACPAPPRCAAATAISGPM